MSGKLYSIQILRAIAALSVVLFHSHFAINPFPKEFRIDIPFLYKYGYLGVDLFFVISGFIISHITYNKKFDPASFAIKRFIRIFPLYWIFCILAFYLFITAGLRFGPKDPTIENLLASLAIFPIEGSPAYGVGWSLEHEIIFYLLSAIILSLTGSKQLMICLVALGVAGITKEILISSGTIPKFWDFHLLSPFNLCFFAGVFVHRISPYLTRKHAVGLGCATALVIGLTAYFMQNSIPSVRIATRYAGVAASCLLIVAFALSMESYRSTILAPAGRALIAIGNASYSLYLVHWIILVNMGRMKYKIAFGAPDWSAELWRFGWVAVCVVLSLAMYRFFERPLNEKASIALNFFARKA